MFDVIIPILLLLDGYVILSYIQISYAQAHRRGKNIKKYT